MKLAYIVPPSKSGLWLQAITICLDDIRVRRIEIRMRNKTSTLRCKPAAGICIL